MLAALGFAMITAFMALVTARKLSALVALILLPLFFGVVAGHGADLASMALGGVAAIAPTATLILFAVLYFSIMVDAGLFDPLVTRALRFAGNDPVRVAIGTAVVAIIVSLDGDGATTALITITAFLPVYRRLGMNVLILAVILLCANSVLNLAPWGGPLARVASVLKLDPADLFFPLLPTIAVGVAATLLIAWHLGRVERLRLQTADHSDARTVSTEAPSHFSPGHARPRLFPFNIALTLLVLTMAVAHFIPLPFVFIVAFATALAINYPSLAEQRARIAAHSANALQIVVLILAAGIFTGVLEGTGMIAAMARALLGGVPEALGSWFGPLTALLAAPLTFFLSNDAFYFGVVPILAEAAALHGVPTEDIGRASLLAQPVHALSPLVAALYLVSGMLDVDVGAQQRFCFKWAVLLSLILIATASLTSAIV